MKVISHMIDKSCDMILQLLKNVFPNGSILSVSQYEAKKKLQELGLRYESIHLCNFDCALFWKEHEKVDKCPICDEPRYKIDEGKDKRVPHKMLRSIETQIAEVVYVKTHSF